jgi:hypothetical protein
MENIKGKVKKVLKELFASKLGWISIIIANVLWSMWWFPFIVIGVITGDNKWFVISGSIYLFFLQPLVPMWLIIPITALWILKYLKPKQPKE